MSEPTFVGPNDDSYGDPALKLFERRVKRAKQADRKRREGARQFYRTYAGDPWPEGVKEQIETRDQTPAINFNYTFPTINNVLGDQMENRREITFRPVSLGKGDDVVANWVTRIVRQFYALANGHRAESRAIYDQLLGGTGWVHVWLDHSHMPPRLTLSYVPESQMWRDPDAVQDNYADGRFLMRQTMWDIEDAEARWPNSAGILRAKVAAPGVDPFPTRHTSDTDQHDASSASGDRERSQVSVWEYQFRRGEEWVAYLPEQPDPQTGEMVPAGEELIHMPAKEFDKLFRAETEIEFVDSKDPTAKTKRSSLQKFARMKQTDSDRYQEVSREESNLPQRFQRYTRNVYYTSKALRGTTGKSDWLDEPTPTGLDFFSYVAFNGFWKKDVTTDRLESFGLVEPINDTQLLIAKVITQTVQMLTRAAKGGGFVASGALANPENFQQTQGVPGKWHLLKPGVNASQAIYPNPSVNYPQFHAELLRICQTAIPQMTAVTEYSTGTSTRERSNVLVTNLQSRSRTTLTPIFDPVESGRIQLGRLMLQMIQQHVPDWVIEQILGEDADVEGVTYETQPGPDGAEQRVEIATAVALIKRRSVGEYHVVADTGEATVYEKQAILNVMGQVLQTAAETGGPVDKLWPILVRAFPLPKGKADELAEEMENEIKQQAALKTKEGIEQAIGELPPEDLQEIMQVLQQLLGEAMPPPEQQGQAMPMPQGVQ